VEGNSALWLVLLKRAIMPANFSGIKGVIGRFLPC
jgi:hypothetical protein